MCRHPNVNDVVPGLIVLNADDFVRIADDKLRCGRAALVL